MTGPDKSLENYDQYISQLFAVEDPVLQATRATMQQEGLRPINVSATGGQLLYLLALMNGARRILEIGTLGGYSAIWLARALQADGALISLDIDAHHAAVARRNLAQAGLDTQVEVRVGPALATLTAMAQAREAPFDLVFIDADKDGYVAYLQQAVALVREGGLILADNTLPDEVLDANRDSGAKRYNAAVAAHPALVSSIVPVLRRQGFDGLTISIKRTPRT
ncbi:MAG: O-methyltransferase [Anaerolineales bacterium]|nr:O-methyltransferase [Anaerolineales bacterium]